ncbi:MAG TPA: hypothetical protein VET88_02465 [Gammaproteobacteria bacterium]|nr:hypothetical protein [Gammaproteobacteria bacterium]
MGDQFSGDDKNIDPGEPLKTLFQEQPGPGGPIGIGRRPYAYICGFVNPEYPFL